jgi:short subunit dehydrogenase-like uncharacterized protein
MSDSREFDIVVYGASGFTGRLVIEYLVARNGLGMRWAMAGRSRDKLAEVRDETGADPDTPLLVADAGDPASIRAMAGSTRCVCTVVGPYQFYGSGLVAACAELGTHYVDLSGEPVWMYQMINTHQETAAASGARIVHSCGFDSVPFDLGILFLQRCAREQFGTHCNQVSARVRAMKGAFSGGTAASLNATVAAVTQNPQLQAVMEDPFCLAGGFRGPAQPAGDQVYEDARIGQWVAPFIMAVINTKNIHRSNALMGHPYGTDFIYDEMMVAGPGDKGRAVAEAIASSNPLVGDHAPKPGEGPSREVREAGYFDILFIGATQDGREIRAVVTGDMDPGYGATSKMLAESAACVVQDCSDLPGGFYTSASAMGERLTRRLVERAGFTFELDDQRN